MSFYAKKVQQLLEYDPRGVVEAMCSDEEVFRTFQKISLQVTISACAGEIHWEQAPFPQEALEALAEYCAHVEKDTKGEICATIVAEQIGYLLGKGVEPNAILSLSTQSYLEKMQWV